MTAPNVEQANLDLLVRARSLHAELEQFKAHLVEMYDGYFQQVPQMVHLSFSGIVKAECENLERAAAAPPAQDQEQDQNDGGLDSTLASHRLQSSNLPFYEALWDTAKRAQDIVMLRLGVASQPPKSRQQILAPGVRIVRYQGDPRLSRDCNIVVDVVADRGHTWYKVSTMNNKRLMFDMAREAVFCGDSEEESEEDWALSEDADLPLVKLARNLVEATRWYRIRTTTPTPVLVLPRLIEGKDDKIDKVIEVCRKLGVTMLCGSSIPPTPALTPEVLRSMSPSPRAHITQVLNVDTSILVSLASDFSHSQVEKLQWWKSSHEDHAELESKNPILPSIYPVMEGRELACTKEAAETFRHIIATMATPSEAARASLLLEDDSCRTKEQRLGELRGLSIHGVPDGLELPIRIVSSNEADCQDRLPEEAKAKMEPIPNPGRAVFGYGWAAKRTTITCNSVVVRQLEKDLEALSSLDDWPSIWALSTSRPLVGKPKPGAQRVRKHIGDCQEVCTCGIEKLYGSQSDVKII